MGTADELSKLRKDCYKTLGLLNRLLISIETKPRV
jgi:hypothetical protein